MFPVEQFLDLNQCPWPALFEDCPVVWDALRRLPEFMLAHLRPERREITLGSPLIGAGVMIGEGTVVEHGAVLKGPAIIGKNCEIRAGAYVRENVVVGDGCVLGNSSEFKNAVLFNGAQVPHFSYVGDSILGHNAHLGAGVILSNLKSTPGNVVVEGRDTGLRKFGAIIGDGADIGCNCVLNPGAIIGRGAVLYPNVLWRGVCPAGAIVKLRQEHHIVEKRT